MIKENGFITLHRKLLSWQWYQDVNTKTLFIHCLLRANHTKAKWQLIDIDRGQFITSLKSLSVETGLSERQVRTALSKLIKTNELTNKSTNKYRIITVLKYNNYQTVDKQDVKQKTIKRQTDDKPPTTDNNDNNKNNEDKGIKTTKKFVIPTVIEIEDYCKERKNNINANQFFDSYESKGWLVGKNKMKDWKAAVRTWERNNFNIKQEPKEEINYRDV